MNRFRRCVSHVEFFETWSHETYFLFEKGEIKNQKQKKTRTKNENKKNQKQKKEPEA